MFLVLNCFSELQGNVNPNLNSLRHLFTFVNCVVLYCRYFLEFEELSNFPVLDEYLEPCRLDTFCFHVGSVG